LLDKGESNNRKQWVKLLGHPRNRVPIAKDPSDWSFTLDVIQFFLGILGSQNSGHNHAAVQPHGRKGNAYGTEKINWNIPENGG